MGKSLNQIAQELKDTKHITKAKAANKDEVKVQLIYAFNGVGKTRLSREFKLLVEPNSNIELELKDKKILYYNAFTEDLFHWDNDLDYDKARKLLIRPNAFTKWVFEEQGQENNIANKFKKYSSSFLTPSLNPTFTESTFSYKRGNGEPSNNIKISKGEESCFIWCIFFSMLEDVIDTLIDNEKQRIVKTNELKYVFIDDPVTSLDDSHLIQLAVDLAELIKKAVKYDIKFIITTHSASFYNILACEFNNNNKDYAYKNSQFIKHVFDKLEDGTFILDRESSSKSPFSYHLFLKNELEKCIKKGELRRYHFNLLRNMYEKSATFLGYETFKDLLPKISDGKADPYANRIINAYSHLKHSDDEIASLDSGEKEAIERLFKYLMNSHKFKE